MGVERVAALLLLGNIGCGGPRFDAENPPVGTSGTSMMGSPSGVDAGSSTSGGEAGSDSSEADGGTSAIFDLAGPELPPYDPYVPTTCDQAERARATVGCLFYGAKLPQFDANQGPVGVAVANPQLTQEASVEIQVLAGGAWTRATVDSAAVLGPGELAALSIGPASQADGSALDRAEAFRVTADVPIVAYQFNPVSGANLTSDASLLRPVTSWGDLHYAVGVEDGAYVVVIAGHDGTEVEFTAAVDTRPGAGIPAGQAGIPFTVTLDDADTARIEPVAADAGLSGLRIQSSRPVAVFSGNRCTTIPYGVWTCDHIEEQEVGVRQWGTRFVAARMPVREPEGTPEPVLWQVVASEDDTHVVFAADAAVTGLPDGPVALGAGDMLRLWVSGDEASPGDFVVEADRPVAVVGYMVSQGNLVGEQQVGDPSAAHVIPVDQLLPRYVVLVPDSWENDVLVLTRYAGAPLEIDGEAVPDGVFVPVGDEFEVARVPVDDGVHRVDSSEPVGVLVVGYAFHDSYAYPAGAGTMLINPDPEG